MSLLDKIKQTFSPSVTPAAIPPPPGVTAMTAMNASIPWSISLSSRQPMMSGVQSYTRMPGRAPIVLEELLGKEQQEIVDRLVLLEIEVEYANEVEYMLIRRKPQWRTTKVPIDGGRSFWMAAIEYLARPHKP